MTPTIADPEARVRTLMDDGDELAALIPCGESEAAEFHIAIVERDHPDEDGQSILMERYAQLAAEWSDMSDTFLKNGINRRSPKGDGTLARNLAQAYASTATKVEAGTVADRDVWTPEK